MGAQNIQFRGIRRTPSDITGQDGDLLDCVNLVHENGELKPVAMPEQSDITVPTFNNRPYTLAHIHNTTDGSMFVFVYRYGNNSYLRIRNASGADQLDPNPKILDEDIKWVKSVGNTLVVGTDKSIHYVLYKDPVNKYKWLGDTLPRPVIDFQLEYGDLIRTHEPTPSTYRTSAGGMSAGMWLCKKDDDHLITDSNFNIFDNWSYQSDSSHISSNNVRDNIKSKLAYILGTAKTKNQFIHPFVVRYAIKLYDNTYTQQSQPILMLPSTNRAPYMVTLNAYEVNGHIVNTNDQDWANIVCNIYAYGLPSRLKYTIKHFVDGNNNAIEESDLDDWTDIIAGVDVFCSSQLSQLYNERFDQEGTFGGPFIGYRNPYGFAPQTTDEWLGCSYVQDQRGIVFGQIISILNNNNLQPGNRLCFVQLPSISAEDFKDSVANVSQFYLLKSYKLNNYTQIAYSNSQSRYIDGDGPDAVLLDTLTNLESGKTLPDDYISRGRMTAETGHTYNKRLILGNIQTELPLWYPIVEDYSSGLSKLDAVHLRFVIEKNGKTIVVAADKNNLSTYRFGHYIYYPDSDCEKVIVSVTRRFGSTTLTKIKEIPMQEHEGLNGAYAIMTDLQSLWEELSPQSSDSITLPDPSIDRYYPMRNSIAMAEVANPFTWQATNFKEVGNGSVIDLAPNMMEVSSGQWGQYPLYVFTTDGIYAFGINNDGTLGATSPVSSDVLLTPQGMTKPSLIQANQMLVFLTNRGVMGLQGTKMSLLSEVLNGRHFNAKDDLGLDVVYNSGAFASIMNEAYDTAPFHSFMLGGFLAYDYAHNNVLVLNSSSKYQYVMSLDNGLWSRQVVYSNLGQAQQSQSVITRGISDRPIRTIDVVKMSAAVNNYTEMYLQGDDAHLYITNDVMEENNTKALYQYGYFISRPIRFGTDDFKSINQILHRYTHYAEQSKAKLALYGSRDGVQYYRINSLRGMSWKYFIFVVYTYLKPNERYSYMTVGFDPRLTDKLR